MTTAKHQGNPQSCVQVRRCNCGFLLKNLNKYNIILKMFVKGKLPAGLMSNININGIHLTGEL
jgi:hypothetical protein